MMANKLGVNLARHSYLNRRALLGGYWFLIIVLVGFLAFQGWRMFALQQTHTELNRQLISLDKELAQVGGVPQKEVSADDLAKQQEAIQAVNDILRRENFSWTKQLDRLERLLVTGVTIRAIQPNYKDGALRLSATAEGVDEMRSFIDSLLHSGEFSDVFLMDQSRVQYTDSRDQKHDAINFNLLLKGAF